MLPLKKVAKYTALAAVVFATLAVSLFIGVGKALERLEDD